MFANFHINDDDGLVRTFNQLCSMHCTIPHIPTYIPHTQAGLAGKPLSTDSLRMLHHPRVGAVVSMLHTVIWAGENIAFRGENF